MRISDWSSDVCSSDLRQAAGGEAGAERLREQRRRAATVVAERQCLRAAPPGQTAEGAPEGIGVPLRDRRPDGAAQVVLAQYRGIEAVWRQRIVRQRPQIGRASCREGVCQYGETPVVAVSLKK